MGFAFDDFGTPGIESRDLSGLGKMTFGIKGGVTQVKMEVVDDQDHKASIQLTGIRPVIEQVWEIPVALFQNAVDMTHVRLIYYIVEGAALTGRLEVNTQPLPAGPSCPPASLAKDLRLYYSFDYPGEPSAQGLVIRDQSGYGNNGIVSTPTFSPDGMVNGAYSFDGVKDFIKTPSSDSLNLGKNLSLVTWFYNTKPAGGTENQAPFLEWTRDGGTDFGVHLWSNVIGYQWNGHGTGANLVDQSLNDRDYVISTDNPPINVWHHLAVTYDGVTGDAKVYLDGALVNTRNIGQIIPLTSQLGHFLQLGKRATSLAWLGGMLDEMRVYARVLTADEVRYLAEQRSPRLIASVRFTSAPGAVEDQVQFSRTQFLYVAVKDVQYTGATVPTDAFLCLKQGSHSRKVSLAGAGGRFLGAAVTKLDDFSAGDVSVQVKVTTKDGSGNVTSQIVREGKLQLVP
jgi:hypothetical protein